MTNAKPRANAIMAMAMAISHSAGASRHRLALSLLLNYWTGKCHTRQWETSAWTLVRQFHASASPNQSKFYKKSSSRPPPPPPPPTLMPRTATPPPSSLHGLASPSAPVSSSSAQAADSNSTTSSSLPPNFLFESIQSNRFRLYTGLGSFSTIFWSYLVYLSATGLEIPFWTGLTGLSCSALTLLGVSLHATRCIARIETIPDSPFYLLITSHSLFGLGRAEEYSYAEINNSMITQKSVMKKGYLPVKLKGNLGFHLIDQTGKFGDDTAALRRILGETWWRTRNSMELQGAK